MGAEPYCYVIDYEPDPAEALRKLREHVFTEGTFWGAEKEPRSPEIALEMAGESGTRSILDIVRISERPGYCSAAPLTGEELERYFDTRTPHPDAIDSAADFWEDLERGQARFYVAYQGDEPSHYVFAGYSFD